MAELELEHIFKRFGENTVVRDFHLKVEDGGFVVLVGPSGCGKSTALRMVAGLEEPSEGRIKIGQRDVTELSPRDRDVAMVFQSYALYPHMSVRENMAFGLRLRKMDDAEIDRRVMQAAETLGLVPYLERKPKALSGGQRQRVAMGRAIVRQPAVFLFDEPLSNLDAKMRVQVRAEIAKLHQRLGTTTVYVTHDQVEAMTLAKTIVVMKDGLIQQVGAPLDVYRHPANTFVAGFVGSPAMNFLSGTVEGARIVGPGFALALSARHAALVQPGQRVLVGVRPEHVHLGGEPAISLSAEVIEPLGAEVLVLGAVEGQAFTASLEPEARVRPGETLRLSVDLDHLQLFSAEDEKTIGHPLAAVTPPSVGAHKVEARS
jgi:multiple sugar transport system ATP-binding protein